MNIGRTLGAVAGMVALLLAASDAGAQIVQQGPKLVGTGAMGAALQGYSVALSGDGNTAVVSGLWDNGQVGAAWVFSRSGGVWSQQGAKLVGTGAVGTATQGDYVALSADGNTAVVGGHEDNIEAGAAWVFTRSGGVWSQQAGKLVGTGAVGNAAQGFSVALSADGNTAVVGGFRDNFFAGAAWVWTRSGGVWSQQGAKLVGTGAVGALWLGTSVALSGDGNTAVVGGVDDNGEVGAAWVFTRSAGVWSQQGTKLVGTGAVGNAAQGHSVALSADGNTAVVGGPNDNGSAGAAWVYAVPSNQPPNCAAAMAEPSELWAPNHQLVPIEIVGVTDPDGDPVTIEVTGVTQDEPVNERGDGNTCPDAVIENGQASVRAERSGQGNDRVYAISFTATDDGGESCSGVVYVCVPHDQGAGPPPGPGALAQRLYECQDDGQNYNSLGPCAPRGRKPQSGGAVTSLGGGATVARGSGAQVEFTLAAEGEVDIAVYDLMGRRVMELERSYRAAGTHEVSWDASRLTAGMYFYRLRTGATFVSKPVLILR